MTVTHYNFGDTVICDMCGKDWTNDPTPGGFIFAKSKGVCPDCAPTVEREAKEYGEDHWIGQRCPPDKSHFRWIVEDIRGGQPNVMSIVTGDDAKDMLARRGK